jgi:hypothetical protein
MLGLFGCNTNHITTCVYVHAMTEVVRARWGRHLPCKNWTEADHRNIANDKLEWMHVDGAHRKWRSDGVMHRVNCRARGTRREIRELDGGSTPHVKKKCKQRNEHDDRCTRLIRVGAARAYSLCS